MDDTADNDLLTSLVPDVGDGPSSLERKKARKREKAQRRYEEARETYRARIDNTGWFLNDKVVYDEHGSIERKRTVVNYKTTLHFLYFEEKYEDCLRLGREYDQEVAPRLGTIDPSELNAICVCLLRSALAIGSIQAIQEKLAFLKSTVKQVPDQIDSLRLIEKAHRALGQHEESLEACLIATTLDPRWEFSLLNLGEALFLKDEDGLAKLCLERCFTSRSSPEPTSTHHERIEERALVLLSHLRPAHLARPSQLQPSCQKAVTDILARVDRRSSEAGNART